MKKEKGGLQIRRVTANTLADQAGRQIPKLKKKNRWEKSRKESPLIMNTYERQTYILVDWIFLKK